MRERWSAEQAWDWYNSKPWVMGVNYVPSITLHAIELWQKDTYPEVIKSVRKEFELMQDIGLNGVRMFLPFHIWYHEKKDFMDRLDSFLEELASRGITMMPVLFNDCVGFGRPEDVTPQMTYGWQKYDIGHHGGHRENPFTGECRRVGWCLWDEPEWRIPQEEYLAALLGRFGKDERIYAWDLWNEPGNSNRHDMSIPYIRRVFEAARAMDPVQPLTAGVWSYPENYGIYEDADVEPVQRLSLNESDIITFHQYEGIERVKQVVRQLQKENRPMMNTEWLNRVQDNFIQDNLPLYYEEGIGSYSWGLVAGKSQHFLPWDELWNHRELPLNRWQHDLFDTFFTAYDEEELELMRLYSKKGKRLSKGLKNERD